jgi:hypothetical protein
MTRRLFVLFLGIGFLAGCAHLPLKAISPDETKMLLDDFSSRLNRKYESVSSVLFKYSFFSFGSLGIISIDTSKDYLAVAGMTPVGIKLFQVVAEQGKITQSFAIPELTKRGNVAKAVTENIRETYFYLVPSEIESRIERGNKYFLKTPLHDGIQYEYVFDPKDRVLCEKRLYKNQKLFWIIFYKDWSEDSLKKIHPGSLRFWHKAYGYQLIITTKEIRPLREG